MSILSRLEGGNKIVIKICSCTQSLPPGKHRRFRCHGLRLGLNPTYAKCQPTEYHTCRKASAISLNEEWCDRDH